MNDFIASLLPLLRFYWQGHGPEVRARCFSAACLSGEEGPEGDRKKAGMQQRRGGR